jgi:hypothetical protein
MQLRFLKTVHQPPADAAKDAGAGGPRFQKVNGRLGFLFSLSICLVLGSSVYTLVGKSAASSTSTTAFVGLRRGENPSLIFAFHCAL